MYYLKETSNDILLLQIPPIVSKSLKNPEKSDINLCHHYNPFQLQNTEFYFYIKSEYISPEGDLPHSPWIQQNNL